MITLNETSLELTSLEWLRSLNWQTAFGPDISPDGLFCERDDFEQVVLTKQLRAKLGDINPDLTSDVIEDVIQKVSRAEYPTMIDNNRHFHRMLTEGVDVSYMQDGREVYDKAWLIDFENPENNDFLAVNQYAVIENRINRRPDIVLFINGLPLVVIELKNPAKADADIWTAFHQLQTYKTELTNLFKYNAFMVASDGPQAKFGSITANSDWFLPWRTIEGETLADKTAVQLEVLIKGMCEKSRLLDLIRNFIVFEDTIGGKTAKKIAGYHQYHAVHNALESVIQASSVKKSNQGGVIWHTQGSGKSLTMVFFTGKLILSKEMKNPTVVVITDRIDLDNQLFGVFSRCKDIIRQEPLQIQNRSKLQDKLQGKSGGVYFTTIQKFFPEIKGDNYPELSDRSNIVVIADEAHRSQYEFIKGFARHMRDALPNAVFLGFTGTPVELSDRNTRAVFGNEISVYDIQRAVDDKATVPIFYENRMVPIDIDEASKDMLDPEFERVTEAEEVDRREKLKSKWARMEKVVGTEKRLTEIAKDIVEHFDKRLEGIEGKAMIVCMSRRICVDLYSQLTKINPNWHSEDDERGYLKVIMTGSAADPPDWQQHIRNKERREYLAKRFKDPEDPFKIAIVRDMWLTGFDVPCLHTMYVDKPMRGHALMQAIARVNRKFGEKPGGLIVDYLGLANELKLAMKDYTDSGGKGETAVNQAEAVAKMLEKYEICCNMLHKFDWSVWHTGDSDARIKLLPFAQEHILAQEDGKKRFISAVSDLSKAFALSIPHQEAIRIRDDVGFFKAVRATLAKVGRDEHKPWEDYDLAIQQLISKSVVSGSAVDILKHAGLKSIEISILSDEFLDEVRALPQKNLAVEALERLLNDELKDYEKSNLVQARSFAEMLEKTIREYQNRSLEAVKVIEELIALAKSLKEARTRGDKLGLTEDEVAFYDALETNDSAVQVLGDDTLKTIAQELVQTVRKNTSIDWTVRATVQAKLRVLVKRVLRKYGYPPDKQEKATKTVLEQAELFGEKWAG